MKALFEVVILPVSDPDASLRFYRDKVGFDLDVDYAPAPDFRVIQLTPQGCRHLNPIRCRLDRRAHRVGAWPVPRRARHRMLADVN